MVKEVAIGKRAKISQAQQYMILAVLGASVFLGVAISLVIHFVNQISFNAKIIAAEEQSVVAYSDVIKNIGICQKPSGSIYSDSELDKCTPDNIELAQIPNTLRSNILENIAANEALNSVPKENNSECINQATGKNYTYRELMEAYNNATDTSAINQASRNIKTCSALRIIPDALPAFKNEEALLASLNKLFIASNWEPESISPGDPGESAADTGNLLNTISVNLSIEADSGTTMNVLHNIEKSIREFNIERATIEWAGDNNLVFQGVANAYYMDKSQISETTKTITPEGN